MKFYDLYGFTDEDIDGIASILETALDIRWQKRDSSYFGEYYLFRDVNIELSLKSNFAVEEEGLESEFSAYLTLLYVSRSEAMNDLETPILNSHPQAALLRRTSR